MKKAFRLLLWITVFFLANTAPAAAQTFSVSGHAGIGSFRMAPLAEGQTALSSNLWLISAAAEMYPTSDLRLEGQWIAGIRRTGSPDAPLQGEADSVFPWRVQAAVGYLALQEPNIHIYAGLSYSLTRVSLQDTEYFNDARIVLNGSGFGIHGHVRFLLIEDLTAQASVSAAPWYSWEYQQGDQAQKNINGSSYSYQLLLRYQLTRSLDVFAGYSSQRGTSGRFEFNADERLRASNVFSGLTLGASMVF